MARLLQREYSLPVLRVSLVQEGSTPAVAIEAVVNADGEQRLLADLTETLDQFGFSHASSTKEPDLRVPARIGAWISDWAHKIEAGGALWLYLKKPYGPLGAVPWERDLRSALQVPLLRLPDVLPDTVSSHSTFHVALCATSAAPTGLPIGNETVSAVIRALARGVGPRLRLHVFADPQLLDRLKRELPAGLAETVTVYRPELYRGPQASEGPIVESPWLAWIRQAMDGQTLDAVHFIVHGCALGLEGGVLTSSSPASADGDYPQILQASELRQFLTRVGAAVAGFTTPSENSSDYGLRRTVDDLGATRAGPVLLHDPRADPSLRALSEAYALLASPLSGMPPAPSSLVMFVQPRQVGNMSSGAFPPELAATRVYAQRSLEPSLAAREQLANEDTPLWLAAAERYISDNEAALTRFQQRQVGRQPTNAQTAYFSGVESALGKIRDVIDKHAETR